MNSPPSRHSKKIWAELVGGISSKSLRWAKIAFMPIALLFLSVTAWNSWDQLAEILRQAQLRSLTISVLIWMLAHLLSSAFTYLLISACGTSVSFRFALTTHVSRLPARYLPGGIWHTVARVNDFHARGIQPKHLTAFVILENVIALSVTFIFGGLIVAWHQDVGAWRIFSLTAAIGAILAISIAPLIINHMIFKSQASLTLKRFVAAIAVACVFWLFASIAFLFYLSAFPGALQPDALTETAGAYLFSWGVGYIAVFAPQGIGVFEAVVGDILRSSLSFSSLATLILGFRLVIIVADIASWSLWAFTNFMHRAFR